MFEPFLKLLNEFENKGIENPLVETLKVFNVLTRNAINGADFSILDEKGLCFDDLVAKRLEGVPLEYILEAGVFFGKPFICLPGALIPREETELLVRTVLDRIDKVQNGRELRIVDMGTGCGSIAVSIALNTNRTSVYASDLNAETVAVARKNIEKYHLSDRITLFQGDLFEPFKCHDLAGKIDIVVCNPPYIPSTSLKNMASEIINHEPEEAFNGGAFGIEFFRRLIRDSLIYLKPEGMIFFEIGAGQDKLVSRLFHKIDGYEDVEYVDNGDVVRVIGARKKR